MKKIILLAFLAIGLFSCDSHLDKSVLEPLTNDELKEIIDKDSTFVPVYKAISYIRDSVITSEAEKKKFTDLTYQQIYDFAKSMSDTAYSKPIERRIKKEWNEKYGIYKEKVDSVSNYWKKYKEENPNADVPESISDYWEHGEKESGFYFQEVISDIFGVRYIDDYGYKITELDKIIKEKDPLIFEFLRASYRK